MSTSNLATYPSAGTYGENLGRAARGLLGALLAVRPQQAAAVRAQAVPQVQPMNLKKLYRLAGGFDSVKPRVVAELNAIADA